MVRQILLIVMIVGIILFSNFGVSCLWDCDEFCNVGCVVEMMSCGDWVVSMFNIELRIYKFILLYWFIMVVYVLFGVNEFVVRFLFVLLVVGLCLLIWNIGCCLFVDCVGLWVVVILVSSLMFDVVGCVVILDLVLIFFFIFLIYLFVCGIIVVGQEIVFREQSWFLFFWFLVVGMYVVMGFVVLVKGLIGMVLLMVVIGMYLLIVCFS